MAAELDRNDLALAHGYHAAILPELAAQAAVDPFDERLAGQLMLAQYRSGRQAEAMEHYQQLRQRLSDDHGGQPSPPLRRLNQQIKTADPALTLSSRPPAATTPKPVDLKPVSQQLSAEVLRTYAGPADGLARVALMLPSPGEHHTSVTVVVVSNNVVATLARILSVAV
jgi:hypothetical protein